ncbi:uncharacterized protein DUF4179 [Kineothrix alysoides]|uniref:Uncharacterized protein DUF4179 n=1 Tax=Kineothrix alysoides TaxID=1469948 RepID=A0A4R1QSS5_9FIRM|nr:DUF4179 domain-containing protein [Kineothrix alysoides]TCL56959.1 uncharacterized protein DUF4179 [Kineothrix alysoides]
MSKIYDWENVLPEVPAQFHNKICKALDSLPQEKRICRLSRKKYIIFVAAAVMLFSSLTVFAALKWNQRAIERFGADENLQQSLSESGYSDQSVQSVSDSGITITLEQTIQDENLIYILFRITAEQGDITANSAMDYELNFSNGMDAYASISSSFTDSFQQPETSGSREYEIWIQKNTDYDFNGASLSCNFSALQEYGEKAGTAKELAKGEWNFSIDLSANDSVSYDINRTITLADCNVKVRSLRLSPLSYSIYCDGDDVQALQKANGINFNELDITYPLIITGIQYTDGTVLPQEVLLMSEGFQEESGEYTAVGKFGDVLDMSQIQAIILGDSTETIPIK